MQAGWDSPSRMNIEKWSQRMSTEDKKPLHPARSTGSDRDVRRHPETFFLPPLKMILSFLDRESRQSREQADDEQKESKEKTVNKLIEKLSEKDE